jgi:hypothetical protein
VQVEWVLTQVPVRKVQDPEVVDALQRLQAMRTAEPSNPLWPDTEGRLRVFLGQHAEAFHAYSAALSGIQAGPNYDRVALGAVRAAEAAGLKEEGAVFVAALNPLASEEAKAELATLSTKLAEKPPDPESPDTENTPSPAETDPLPVKGEEPPKDVDPAKKDGVPGKAETPPETPPKEPKKDDPPVKDPDGSFE